MVKCDCLECWSVLKEREGERGQAERGKGERGGRLTPDRVWDPH